MAALAVLPMVPSSLYDLEASLEALNDTAEIVAPEQQQEFHREFAAALAAAADKRDRVARYIVHLGAQANLAAAEIKRLQDLKRAYEARQEKLEEMVIKVIQSLPLDAKARPRKLEGHTSTMSVRNNPATVAIQDEAAVPPQFKTVSVTLPLALWEGMLDSLDLELSGKVLDAVKRPDQTVVKALVKAGIEAAVPGWKEELKSKPAVFTPDIPGATIAAGTVRLVVE